jgi:hypothetical protein
MPFIHICRILRKHFLAGEIFSIDANMEMLYFKVRKVSFIYLKNWLSYRQSQCGPSVFSLARLQIKQLRQQHKS